MQRHGEDPFDGGAVEGAFAIARFTFLFEKREEARTGAGEQDVPRAGVA